MTPVFCCGFECGVLGTVGQHWKTNHTAPTISTSIVRTGNRSVRINGSSIFSSAQCSETGWSSGNVRVIRGYIYFTTLPTLTGNTPVDLFGVYNGTKHQGAFFNTADNKIYAGASETELGATGVAVTTGQWYLIDVRVDCTNNPWLIDVQVNGQACGQATKATAAAAAGAVVFGSLVTAYTLVDMYLDDVLVSKTAADYPLGAGYVNHFVPASDGTHSGLTAGEFKRTLTGTDIVNATTTAYQLIDDVPLESGAGVDWINMVAPNSAADYVECKFGPAPGISTPSIGPRMVSAIAGIHQFDTTTGNMEITLVDNGSGGVIYSATTVAGTTTIIYKINNWSDPPSAATVWNANGDNSNGDFRNLKVRFGSPAAVDAAPDQYLDCIMVEAEFASRKSFSYGYIIQ